MARMIVVNEDRYKELCSEFLKLSEKYKESLGTITKLLKELEAKKSRKKKDAGKTEPNEDC